MILPASTNPPAVPRRVVVFGLLLSLSLALLGIVGSHLVAELNGSYQEIVVRQLPSISIMRAVSQANSFGRRMLDSLSTSSSMDEINAVEERLREMRDSNTLRLAKLQGLLNSDRGQYLTEKLLSVRKRYREQVDGFVRELKEGMTAQQRAAWAERLANADEEYVMAQDQLADYCTTSAVAVSDVLSVRSQRLVSYFLLIAAWPLILAVAFFVYGLISTLVLFHKRNR